MKTLIVPTAAKKTVSLLLALILLLSVSVSLIPAAMAEETTSLVRFSISLKENLILAKYGVMVYLDGRPIEFLKQGNKLTFTAELNDANHVLKIRAGVSEVAAVEWKLGALKDAAYVYCTIQTHTGSMELMNQWIRDVNGNAIGVRFSDNANQTSPVCSPMDVKITK